MNRRGAILQNGQNRMRDIIDWSGICDLSEGNNKHKVRNFPKRRSCLANAEKESLKGAMKIP